MQLSHQGFTWEPSISGVRSMKSREEALAAMEAIPPCAAGSKLEREALAAYDAKDFGRAVECAEHASEWASEEKWR